jgi:VCBS repeat-containing protein
VESSLRRERCRFPCHLQLNGIFQSTDLYFTTEPGYSAAGGSGSDDEINTFTGTFGDSTAGTAMLRFSPSTVGLDPLLVVDGLHVGNVGEGGPANGPPAAVDDSYNTDEDATLDVAAPGILGNDTDPDGDPLSAVLKTDVSNGSLTLNPDGSFSYRPDPDFSGTDSFAYDASDGGLVDTATVSITVDPVNDPPVAVDDSYNGSEDTALNVATPGVLVNDTDVDGDTLTAGLDTDVSNGSLTLNADGSFSYTPDPGFTGSDSFIYAVSDGVLVDTATVTITVDLVDAAPMAADDSFSVDEDVTLNITAPGVLGNDSDPDGDPLTAVLNADVSNGSLTLNADGSFSYTPDPDFNGTDSFTYDSSDGSLSDTATVNITVDPVIDPPVASDDSYSVTENTVLTVTAPGLLDNDSDPDGDTLQASLQTDVSDGSLLINADGSFSYTPDPDFNGTDSFTYIVSDGALVDTATVSITVNPSTGGEPIGFGSAATGGSASCVVTSLADSGEGSLRQCAEAGGHNVTFAVSGTIDLLDDVDVESNTTINGLGQDVTVVGMLDVKRVHNVIIRHLTITGSDRDAIRVIGSHTLWFDHLELYNSVDGLIDITKGSTDATISWSHFHSHDKMVLINPDKRSGVTARVTLHHNWFDNGGRRYPSAESSDIHGFNNFYDGWSNYGVSITEGARFVSENNVYRASSNERGLITQVPGEALGEAVSSGDIVQGDVVLELRGSGFTPSYSYSLDPTGDVISIVTAGVGPNN